jgi:hypothetical protein
MRRRKMLPARSLLAIKGESKGTATWAFTGSKWFCESSSKHLKSMKGMVNFDTAKSQLKSRGFTWNWIESNLASQMRPPF